MWVTTERPASEERSTFELLALNPSDLHVRHRLVLPRSAERPIGPQSGGPGLAAAGGWVWVEGGSALIKVAPETGRLQGTVALPSSTTDDLASNTAGTILVSVHHGDVLDLLDPSTGAVLARHQGGEGGGAGIAGIADGEVFVWCGLGHESAYQRFDIAKSKFFDVTGGLYRPQLLVSGDRILYSAWNGEGARLQSHNYCGSAATGQALATLPSQAVPLEGDPVAYTNGTLYYLAATAAGDLDRVALPGCR